MANPVNVQQSSNMDYYLNRINGYSKNTIRLKPQTKDSYGAGETIVYRLPTNAIVDLHTLCLRASITTAGVGGTVTGAEVPRFTQGMIRRIDVTAGGVQVGLGSLNDYGGLFSLLALNTMGTDKLKEIGRLEGGFGANKYTNASSEGYTAWDGVVAASDLVSLNAATTNKTSHASNWLGLLGGQFMRYLDTNLLPDVEIRITLTSANVLSGGTGITSASMTWLNNFLAFETIAFGDDSYRQMVDARLASGDPIVIPFQNWASYESSASQNTSSTTQFTVASQSVNGLLGSFRAGNYDSGPGTTVSTVVTPNQKTLTNTDYYGFGAGYQTGVITANTTFQFAIDSKV